MHSSAAVISNINLFKNAANDFIIPSCVPVAYAPKCWLFWWLHFSAGGAMSRIGIVKNFRATVYKFICEFQSEFKECRDIIFAICGHRVPKFLCPGQPINASNDWRLKYSNLQLHVDNIIKRSIATDG